MSHLSHTPMYVFLSQVVTCLLLVLLAHTDHHLVRADRFVGEGLDPYFTARPPQFNNYGQWGHYPNLYQNPNGPLRPVDRFDPNYAAVTPNTHDRHKIEDPGDLRCQEAVNDKLMEYATVATAYGTVQGRLVYFCDEPMVPPHERPFSDQYRADSRPFQYRPITKFRRNVTTFLGIPYAKPPTRENQLRFKTTQVPDQWGSIRADRFRPACPQYKKYVHQDYGIPATDEDCLYMNIYTPWAATPTRTLYPVMIYIHGGHFDHGSGNTFPGHMLAASQEVIVVTFNYRLGLLGFLATADNSSAGNYGMFDQVQAINFVRENIRSFNGDPDRITLFGPDAGAVSAGLLMLSPLTKRYVRRVIAQSGAAVADWGVIKDPLYMRNNSAIAGRAFGCATRNSWILVQCLKSRSATDFTNTEVKPDVGWLTWAPVPDFYTRRLENQFMPVVPDDMLERGWSPDDDFAYMSGITRDEGSQVLYADEDLRKKNYEVDMNDFNRRVQRYVNVYNYTFDQNALKNAINFMYSPWADPSNKTLIRQGLIDMITDSWYTAGNDKMVKLMVNNSATTYMYLLNYTIQGLDLPAWLGVPHDTEYLLASGAPFMDPRFYPRAYRLDLARWTESDRNMSQLIMESWANFAKNPVCRPGQGRWTQCGPTPYALFNTILWQPMTKGNLIYLAMNSTNYTTNMQVTTNFEDGNFNPVTNPYSTSVMWRDYKQKVAQFWNSYIIRLVGRVPPTWVPTIEPYMDELRVYKAATWSVLATLIVLLCLTLICSCLYCRAKSYRYGDAALEEYVHVPVVAPYSAPSTRANSESNLNGLALSNRYRSGPGGAVAAAGDYATKSKYRSAERIYVPKADRHTQV